MIDFIKKLNPPGFKSPNRFKIYKIIARVFDVVKADLNTVFRSFFPFLSSSEKLHEHGKALLIQKFIFDTEETYRERVATASFFVDRQGMRSQLQEVLELIVPGRFWVNEYPRHGFTVGHSKIGHDAIGGGLRIFVKVKDLTQLEEQMIYEYLDLTIDPDIEISVLAKLQEVVNG